MTYKLVIIYKKYTLNTVL